MLGTRRSNLSRPKRTPRPQPQQLHMNEGSEEFGGPNIPLFYVPKNKNICFFDNSSRVNHYNNLKSNSDLTSATTSLSSGSSSYSSQSSKQSHGKVGVPASSKSLTQIAAEKIKESRYSSRQMAEMTKYEKSTVTTASSSTAASSTSFASGTNMKLPSTVLKYMFKCNGDKEGEKIVLNDTFQEPSDRSISSMTTISTLSSRSIRSRRSRMLDAKRHHDRNLVTVNTAPSTPQKKKEIISVVATMGRGGGYMIPIDEMNDLCPFDEDNGVELQLVEDHEYYLSKINDEITEHQRRVEKELRKSRRARHRSGSGSASATASTSSSCTCSCEFVSVELPRTPSQADF